MKVVALSGWKQSGKDTAAEYLIKEHGFIRVAFADVLKDMTAEQYIVDRDHCDKVEHKEQPLEHYPVLPKDSFSLNIAKFMVGEFRDLRGRKPQDFYIDPSGAFLGVIGRDTVQLYWTPRALCILEGSVKRSVDSSYWVQKAIDKVEKLKKPMPEVHYPGLTHFVITDMRYRSEAQQLKQAFGKDLVTVRINRFENVESTDPSERDLDSYIFDITIDNKGSLEEFLNKIKELV